MAQQSHFLETPCLQVVQFVEDALGFTTALATASIRHDAVGAEVVATAHDGDESTDSAATNALRDDVTIGLGGR